MKHLLSLILLSTLSLCQFAGAQQGEIKSPSGRYAICNLGDSGEAQAYFEIRAASGKVLYSPKSDPKCTLGFGDGIVHSYADDNRWSPNEEFVLFTIYDCKLKVTAIYSFRAAKIISLGHVPDGWTVPIRWVSSHTFVVEHRWPMGGRGDTPQTRYRESYRVRSHPFALESVNKTTETTDKDEPEDE